MTAHFVLGVDPGKSFFSAQLVDATGAVVWKARDYPMSREGFETLTADLPEGHITIGVEASARNDDNLMGWLQTWLAQNRPGQAKLIQVNPGQSARFGGPKPRRDETDRSDAAHIAEFSRVYADRLEPFYQDPEAQAMARAANERQSVIERLAATKMRIHEQLLVCFPEFTQAFRDPFGQLARATLRQAPTARSVARRQASSLARIKGGRRSPSLGVERAKKLIDLAKSSVASAVADLDGKALVFLLDELGLLESRINTIDAAVAAYVKQAEPELADHSVSMARQIQLADSVPGVGMVAAANLVLGARGVARFDSGKALAAQWASCPQRVETGTSLKKTHLTARGDHKRRAMLYLCAQIACMYDPAFAFHKWRMIQRGLTPQQAVCACMNRLARVIWSVVANRQGYDVHRMIEQIQIHHGDLWKTFVRLHQDNSKLWKKVDLKYLKNA